MMIYVLDFILLLLGIYCVATKKNLIKICIGLFIIEYSTNLFLALMGYRERGMTALGLDRIGWDPIFDLSMSKEQFLARSVDPIPQTLVETSIVVGLAVLAMLVAMSVRLYEKYGTFDISEIKRLRG